MTDKNNAPAPQRSRRWLKASLGAVAMGVMLASGGAWADDSLPAPICDPNKLYDILTSSFHQTAAQLADDRGWAGWGQQMYGATRSYTTVDTDNISRSKNNSDVAPPMSIMGSTSVGEGAIGDAFPDVKPLLVTTGSATTSHQTVALGNDGKFYAWGTQGNVLPSSYTNGTAVAATTLELPDGISAGEVDMLFASYQFLAMVAKGNVWVLASGGNANLLGDGSSSADTNWHKVKTDDGNDLNDVIAVRGQVGPSGTGAVMALTEEGEVYTWGSNIYLGDGSTGRPFNTSTNRATRAFATKMTLPMPTNGGKVVQIGVTGGKNSAGGTPTSSDLNNSYYVLFKADGAETGELWSLGANTHRQLGTFNDTWSTSWQKVLKPNQPAGVSNVNDTKHFDDVKMFSVQEHDWGYAGTGSVAAIDAIGDVYTWGSNNGNMIGAENGSASDPKVQGDLLNGKGSGQIKARYVEVGGHTTAYSPENSPKFCYVGHLTNGSMGNNTHNTGNPWQFDCDRTPAVNICGADSIGAQDDLMGSIPVPDVLTELSGNIYTNDHYRGDWADNNIGEPEGIFGKVLEPAQSINWGPVPYLDPETGKVYAPAGTTPGDYTIRYEICDVEFPDQICAAADIKVTILGIKAIPDTDSTTPNTPVTTPVTSNDTSPSGEPIDHNSVTVVTQPPNGTVVCKGDAAGSSLQAGECQYTPKPGFKGTDTYTYQVCNSKTPTPECDTTTVTIAVGEPPRIIANDDVGLTSVNVPLRMPVLGNDIPVAGKLNPASVAPKGSITGGPEDANSTVTCASDGYCIFEADKPGTYTYEYEVCLAEPNDGICDAAKVTVTVPAQSGTSGDPDNPLVDEPTIVAGSDYDTTGKNKPVTTTVTGNDWASGGVLAPDSVNPVGSSSANGGTVIKDGSGRIKYTPKTDFVGVDTYEYEVCLAAPNANKCTTTTVQVKVGDPGIAAVDDKTGPNQPYPVGGNDKATDGDLDKDSVKVITSPEHGEVECVDGLCTYTPGDLDNPVDDEYKYEVCLVGMPDICSTATVQILNMTAVDDEKILGSEWTSITVEAGENDLCPVTPYDKGQPKEPCGSNNLTLTVYQNGVSAPISNKDWFAPEFGAVVIDEDTGLPIYTPDPDSFKGEDKFTYLACTKEYPGVCDVATVTIKGTPKMVPELDLPPGAVGVEYPGGKLSCTNKGTAAANEAACGVTHLPPGLTLEQCTLDGADWNQPGKVEVDETVECLITGTPTQPTEKPEEGTPTTPPTGETGFGGCSASGTNSCIEREDTPATGTDPDNPDDKPGEITNKMKAVDDKDTLKSFTGVTTSVFPNDLDSEGKLLVSTVGKLTENSDGAHGTVSCTEAGECTYTPGDTWDGEDSYTYKVCLIAAPAVCDTATVTIVGEPKMVPDLLLPKIVPDVPYEGTLVCTNEGTAAATDVICKVDHETIPPGLTVEYDNCTVQPPLPATAWQDGDSVKIGQKVECPISGIPGEKDQFDPDNPPKGETVWKDPNKPAEDPKRAEVIKEPGILKIVKTVYEGHNSGASCSAAKPELLIVEKDPKMHDLTWCFTVTNNGDQPLGAPIWEDSAYPYMEPTLLNGTLPLAAGQIAVWYFEAKHDRSVVNTVGLEMPVVDASCVGPDVAACEPVDVPPAYNFDNSTATFGMIYDPPFGVKVGTAEGFDTIQWTMVWVNDNAVAAKSVEVSDVIQEPMQFSGELVCQGAGDTQVVADSCVYDETTRKVSVTADFASDLGKTVANAEHPLYISFNVKVPVKPGKSETYENIAEATWQPTDPDSGEPVGEELYGKTTYVPELGIAPPPQEGEPPVITPPTGVDPNDPEGPLGHEPKDEDGNPLPPGSDGTPVDVTAPPVAPVPVDNPFALILLALGLLGLGARYARKRSAA